tara:strand:- start:129 stop:365 length:237 start_codon:yes stop_codon:yes gene_type:complete
MKSVKSKNKAKLVDNLNIGSCIKIENSNKTFQIIGINNKKSIFWIREWPLNFESYQTFGLSTNKIKISTVCPNIKNRD